LALRDSLGAELSITKEKGGGSFDPPPNP
jgi:hypothetical protein